MRKRVLIFAAVLVITVVIVGILARNGSTGIEVNADPGEGAIQNTVADTPPAAGPAVEPVAADVGNLSRGYIDVDRSGDWSEGDIPLDSCEDGYIVPVE